MEIDHGEAVAVAEIVAVFAMINVSNSQIVSYPSTYCTIQLNVVHNYKQDRQRRLEGESRPRVFFFFFLNTLFH